MNIDNIDSIESHIKSMIRYDYDVGNAIKNVLIDLLLNDAYVQDTVVESMKKSIKREKGDL